jgi:type VI secretion system secreted protein VgrG
MAPSQNDRMIRITTPLADKDFIVLSLDAIEKISSMFTIKLELASKRNDITFDMLAGKNVTVSVRSSHNDERYFNGIVVSLSPAQVSEKEGYNKYSAIVKPAAWLLGECYDCRIFQDKSVPDILKEVLGDGSLKAKEVMAKIAHRFNLSGSYPVREFCVQYNESDLNFISRLCEEEGIFYFFKHEEKDHTLIFADSANQHKPHIPGEKEKVQFQKTMGGHLKDEVITALQQHKKLTVGKYAARDYNFTIPNSDMSAAGETQVQNPKGQGEQYEYPGIYDKGDSRGNALAKIRMEANDVRIHTLHGRSNCRGFVPGFRFLLADHPLRSLKGKSYVFTMVRHEARQDFTSSGRGGDAYSNIFSCIPHSIPFRPLRKTDKPLIVSSQTAIVTGPTDEEIHTDDHGRVKVKFFWDRRDKKKDGNMSCWIRVSQNWAGDKWGAMHIPRVNQEVIVNFLDGDPDRPIITGRVYHGANQPPYPLPAEKTKSTIKSNSSKGGENYNEIGFEDLAGQEILFTHAARDQNEVVENDMSTEVKNNQEIKVKQNRDLTVASGNETITIDSGTRDVKVGSDEKHANAADFGHKVSGSYTLKVNGNITIDASGIVKISGAKIVMNG